MGNTSITIYELDSSSGRMSTFFGIPGAAAECADYVNHYFNCCDCTVKELID